MKNAFENPQQIPGEETRETEEQIEERYHKDFGSYITKRVFDLRTKSPDEAIFSPAIAASKLQELSQIPETTLEQFQRFHNFVDRRLTRLSGMEENVSVLAESPMKGLTRFLGSLRGIPPDSQEEFDLAAVKISPLKSIIKYKIRGDLENLRMSNLEQVLKENIIPSIDLASKVLKGLPSDEVSSIDFDKDTKLTASNLEEIFSVAKDGDLESVRKLLAAAASYLKAMLKTQEDQLFDSSSDNPQDAVIAGERDRILKLWGLSKEDRDEEDDVLIELESIIKYLSQTNRVLDDFLKKARLPD